jgi:hypothetical protein
MQKKQSAYLDERTAKIIPHQMAQVLKNFGKIHEKLQRKKMAHIRQRAGDKRDAGQDVGFFSAMLS